MRLISLVQPWWTKIGWHEETLAIVYCISIRHAHAHLKYVIHNISTKIAYIHRFDQTSGRQINNINAMIISEEELNTCLWNLCHWIFDRFFWCITWQVDIHKQNSTFRFVFKIISRQFFFENQKLYPKILHAWVYFRSENYHNNVRN